MDARLRQRVRERAGGHCEYCGLPEEREPLPFHVEPKNGICDQPQRTQGAHRKELVMIPIQRTNSPAGRMEDLCNPFITFFLCDPCVLCG